MEPEASEFDFFCSFKLAGRGLFNQPNVVRKFQFPCDLQIDHVDCSWGPSFTMPFKWLLLTSVLGLLSQVRGDSLEKWTEIASKSRSNVIRLNEQTFDQLVTTDRNYTAISLLPWALLILIIVTLTALTAQHQCALCREFDPGFSIVAQSWRKAHPQSDGVFFAKIDFAEARSIFVRVLSIVSSK